MIDPTFGHELTEEYCDRVIMMRHRPKYIGKDTFYSLGHFTNFKVAKEAADIVRTFGYNARVIEDFGPLVLIRKKSIKRRK